MDGSHSIFQDTIARNMAYCDEFVVVTNREYQFIVENQLKVFQGLTWRLVLEEEARKTTAAILLACLEFPLSELIFIVPSDHLIQGEAYKDAINEAGVLAREGSLVTSECRSGRRIPGMVISAAMETMGEIRGEAGWSAGAEIPAGFQISDQQRSVFI
ncbi:MAG: sugar phosphate nucleotidyltransferase [Gallintestinimicrobium sp.]